MTGTLRVGVDVGGTFTKAVAVEPHSLELRAQAVVPTTHQAADGVTAGVALALQELLAHPAVSPAAVDVLEAAGCTAIAASGAFAVDAPDHERLVAARARERGLPTCAGHELSAAYGLELRTVSAAVNASILPLMERTAGVVEGVLHREGIDVPLLVLRGDGGAMSLEAFRRAPSFSIGAGPAAGVAAALHELRLTEGIVLECGGTSSNVSVVKHGRTVLRSLKIMGQPTAIRSVDSWVVGAAGGSMGRLKRRGIAEGGPRSAHIAGL